MERTAEQASLFARLQGHWLEIDPRSVGLFRATIGLVLLLHVIGRWTESQDFYGPSGVLPAHLVAASREIPPFPTAMTLIEGSPAGMTLFFLVTLTALACLTVGLFARWSALLSLVAFSSLAHRNPYLLIGGDYVLGSMLLWMQVLPIADRFSLDALLRRRSLGSTAAEKSEPLPRPSLAALGVLLQLGLIYLASAWQKSGSTWWQDGTALTHVLGLQRYLRPGAELLGQCPESWLALLTRAVLVVEYLVLPLILLPLARPWPRRAALLGLVALHLGIACVLDAGVFSITMLACLPLLLSSHDWDLFSRLEARLFRKPGFFQGRVFLERSPANKAKPDFSFTRYEVRLALTELASLWLLLGMVAANYNLNFAVSNREVSLSPLDLPWRFAPAYQRWDMFTPDAPKCDPQLLVRVRLLDGRLLEVSGDAPALAAGMELAPRFDSFAWRSYIGHAILSHDPKRQAEADLLRTELCRFLTREWATGGQPTRDIFTVELWARSMPTKPLPGQSFSTTEPYWISSHDLAAERRERLARR